MEKKQANKKDEKKERRIETRQIPFIVSGILFLVSFIFYQNVGLMGNLILLALVIGAVPYAFLSYLDYSRIKSIEEQLPLFLSDLSEAQKIGMTLTEALKQVAKTDYGKLTGEVRKIDYQISWGVPTQEAMSNFALRMKKSKLIGRVIRIINEAYSSGGDIARTMETTASDINQIKEAEKERRAITYEHMLIMYAIYFIFIGIVIGLSQTLIPLMNLNMAGGETAVISFNDPCQACANDSSIYCVNCSIFSIVCKMFAIEKGCYFYAMFLLMAVIQGIFSGLVAGQIGEGSVTAGFKHSAIMTLSGFGIILFLLKIGVI